MKQPFTHKRDEMKARKMATVKDLLHSPTFLQRLTPSERSQLLQPGNNTGEAASGAAAVLLADPQPISSPTLCLCLQHQPAQQQQQQPGNGRQQHPSSHGRWHAARSHRPHSSSMPWQSSSATSSSCSTIACCCWNTDHSCNRRYARQGNKHQC